MDRCYNPKSHAFIRYGGRGIEVCDAWHDFKNFSQDVSNRPSRKHTIDRIDNSLGYFPNNVRWATNVEQSNNRRTNRTYRYRDRAMTISQIAREVGMWKTTLRDRLDSGMCVEKATTLRVYKNPHRQGIQEEEAGNGLDEATSSIKEF